MTTRTLIFTIASVALHRRNQAGARAVLPSGRYDGRLMSDAKRLEALEFKVAHLERGLQELGDVIVRQQADFDRLQGQFRRLADQLLSLPEQGGLPEDPHQVPPHY